MIGKTIEIIPSDELDELRLHALVGRIGEVIEKSANGKGYFVALYQSYKEEKEWYIPKSSIQIISHDY